MSLSLGAASDTEFTAACEFGTRTQEPKPKRIRTVRTLRERLDALGLLASLQLGHEQAVLYPGSRPRHLLCKTVFLTIEAEQSCLDFPKRNLCGL